MKKIKIIIALTTLLVLTGCFNKENNNEESNTGTNEVTNKKQEIIVNNVYEEIVDDKVGLKNATNEQLDKILQEEIRINNTPTSKYPFFEQSSSKKADLEEIKKAGGLEVTRGNIFLHGFSKDYIFLNELLSENEKLYTFNQEGMSLFFIDGDINKFLDSLKNKFTDFKIITKDNENIMLEFKNKGINYSMNINIGKGITRDDLDNIINSNQKSKVTISILK
ncbi:MAG: hypothetical protein Q8K30_02850 [Candidatus Gracilibacteria bacterium]|nr:hypothetical protein [Candidatus Gracilibacteria bacterium]